VRPVIQERVSSELSFRSARMAERNSLMYCWVKRKRSLTSDLSHFPLTKSTLDTGTKCFSASDLTSFDIS